MQGRPVAATSRATSYTAPSTQPPDTLPTTSPAADTASAAPGSRGALLNVRTTVARPKVSPACHHAPMSVKMSRTPSDYVRADSGDHEQGVRGVGRLPACRRRVARTGRVRGRSLDDL